MKYNRNNCQVLYLDLKILTMLKRTGHRYEKNLGVKIDASWQFIMVPPNQRQCCLSRWSVWDE